jgi:hypothetical protein
MSKTRELDRLMREKEALQKQLSEKSLEIQKLQEAEEDWEKEAKLFIVNNLEIAKKLINPEDYSSLSSLEDLAREWEWNTDLYGVELKIWMRSTMVC